MSDILRWGLLSTARINSALIPGVLAAKRSQLVAVGSRGADKAQKYAQEWGIPRFHDSYEDLLADPQVDVIYNSLPNHLHAEWTIKALNAGKHVLVEKPIALSVEQVRAVADAARSSGKICAEAFMYRHHPQTLKVQELIASGAIGEVKFIQGSFTFVLNRPGDIRSVLEFGGGSLWDIGCYPLSYSRMVAGAKPIAVHGFQVLAPTGIDLTFSGQMEYPNGILANFYSSFGLPFHTYIEVRGTKGRLSVISPFKPLDPDVPVILVQGNEEKKIFFPKSELYLGEVEDMEAAVLDHKAQRVSLKESEENIATIRALLDSARTGQVVKL
jgi:D-xylose 1-dehydrogenase (NADP+, D-xylono-1,5-lactone-forming)